jgi:hypothetical protein
MSKRMRADSLNKIIDERNLGLPSFDVQWDCSLDGPGGPDGYITLAIDEHRAIIFGFSTSLGKVLIGDQTDGILGPCIVALLPTLENIVTLRDALSELIEEMNV